MPPASLRKSFPPQLRAVSGASLASLGVMDRRAAPWVDDESAALLTDLYELTMLRAYWAERMHERAVFSLFFRSLPKERNFILACGLDDVLRYLERLRFSPAALDYLRNRHELDPRFVDWLSDFRFAGDVWALPEGTPVFPNEPLLEIGASIGQAQLVETFVLNQVHMQSLLASKAARVVLAAGSKAVVDFGLRRMHGTDAGLKGARAYYIAGLTSTSNVLAGQVYGIPIAGTMAHSYIQAHDDELEAFRAFARVFPHAVLLVDTYDTVRGVENVAALARELGERFDVKAVRLDSGDLGELAVAARRMLDDAGLERVGIFASGSLDEYEIASLLERGAPIDAFGVGSRMGVSSDVPYLDMAYKLVEYAGKDRLKLSTGKRLLPGRKQIFRSDGEGDVLAAFDEALEGRPLLERVMQDGRRTPAGLVSLTQARKHTADELARLPDRLLALEQAKPPYPVKVSERLMTKAAAVGASAH